MARLGKAYATSTDFNRNISFLKTNGILANDRDFPNRVYRLLGRINTGVEEVACTIDPFSYISHLSAMSHHGLTNRLPVKLFISSPAPKKWREEANKQMIKDLGDDLSRYREEGQMPLLVRLNMKKIGTTDIHRFNSIHWGAYRNVRGKATRVSTIGRTFLDMLKNPELCGGISHVLEVFEKQAKTYLPTIVQEIDRNGSPIDKVRAGYIIDEKMKLQNEVVESWVKFATRGGSRKLDPTEEYMPNWSEKWCLSINI